MFLGNLASPLHTKLFILLLVIYFPLGCWLRYQRRGNRKESHYVNVCFAIRGIECKRISLHRRSMHGHQTFAWAQELLLTREWTDPSANSIRNISSWNIYEVSLLPPASAPVRPRSPSYNLTHRIPSATLKTSNRGGKGWKSGVLPQWSFTPNDFTMNIRPERGKAVV